MHLDSKPRMDEGRTRGHRKGSKHTVIHQRVAQLYYSHGLLCVSYPAPVIILAVTIGVICCYPLLNLPLTGSLAVQVFNNGSTQLTDPPRCYVQQVVLRVAVMPWQTDVMVIADAFRAPLYEAFKLLDIVRNYEDTISSKTLGHVCLHVEAIKKSKRSKNVLPEYSCLVLSPANLWKQDVQQFAQDNSLLSTVFNNENLQKGKTSIAQMLFGMHLADTGVKRYPLRNRQRVLQYAVTLFFSEYDEQFVSGLRNKLITLYPLHSNESNTASNNTVLIHYPGELNYSEYIPLLLAYMLLFVYYYFSVRKIELIISKIRMALAVVVTVLFSYFMNLGLCSFFGLIMSADNQVFPYLVILIGLENVLVLTKSVVTTPQHLDIKIRVAQGLSKEGWSITKNLMIEITIMTIGLFTFVPAIQEFSIFAIVGLLVDFFLQMTFFSPILGIGVRQAEKCDGNFKNNLYHNYEKFSSASMNRSKSHPRLNSMPANIVAGQTQKQEKRIPKRLRLVNIWARTRFFQRSFMILMVIWISRILYNSGIIEKYFKDFYDDKSDSADVKVGKNYDILPILNNKNMMNFVTHKSTDIKVNNTDELNKLKHGEYIPWLSLNTQHWYSILKKYNISLSGGYIKILPNIRISHVISPEQAALLRNPDEKYGGKFEWQALALALDPIDFTDTESVIHKTKLAQADRPLYPNSPMEFFLTAILCIISVVVLAYAVFVLYKCICSRNYAEWRASWASDKSSDEGEVPVLLEAVPVVLRGHKQEIECLVTDGISIVSSCLGGSLKVWDTTAMDLITTIDRRGNAPSILPKSPDHSREDDMNCSDYESGSPPSRDDSYMRFPCLKQQINTNFSSLRYDSISASPLLPQDGFDFGDQYRQLYLNFRVRRRNNSLKCYGHCAGDGNGTNVPESCDSCDNKPKVSPIWCMDFVDNLIVIGCADGRMEFWEGTTSKFKCIFDDESGIGITAVKIVGSRVIAARLLGTVDFLQLQTFNQGRPIDWNFTSAYRRTHVRTGSAGSISDYNFKKNTDNESEKEELRCLKVLSTKAHQQPLTCLECEGGRVVTGSQDHTLKVFRLEDATQLYTLHGHFGPISCLFIDRVCPATAGSGSQDGMLCVWDLLTGACMYSIQAHDGAVTSLTYSASYVISLGCDEKIRVWERFQGHLLNSITVAGNVLSQLMMLSPHLLIAARAGGLTIYDVRDTETVRTIMLGHSPVVCVKQLVMLRNGALLCDYGKDLQIVRFPVMQHKYD